MAQNHWSRRRWFLPVIVVTVLIIILLVGAFAYNEWFADHWFLVPNLTSDHSNIAARGVVTETYFNFTSYGLGGPVVNLYTLRVGRKTNIVFRKKVVTRDNHMILNSTTHYI